MHRRRVPNINPEQILCLNLLLSRRSKETKHRKEGSCLRLNVTTRLLSAAVKLERTSHGRWRRWAIAPQSSNASLSAAHARISPACPARTSFTARRSLLLLVAQLNSVLNWDR